MILTKDRGFYRSLVLLSLPIALQNLITFAVGFADNVMISALGDSAVSGVYMANQVQTLLQLMSGGIESAILVLCAQYWGRRDTESIRRISAIGIRFSMIFGLAVTLTCLIAPQWVISLFSSETSVIESGAVYLRIVCLSYLFFCLTQALIASMRSVEVAKIGLYVSAASLVINVVLNYLLIFGKLGLPAMGIRGAAMATVISRACETAIILAFVLVRDKRLNFRLRYLLVRDKALTADFIRYGLPLIAGQLVWACNMLTSSAIMGRQSADGVVAGLSVAQTMHNLAYVTMNGMAGAVGIITGKTVGAGRVEKMKEYAKTVQVLFIILGIVTGGAILLLKKPFISLYGGLSSSATAQANALISVISVTIIGTCYQCACLFGLVKSGGDTGFVFKNDLIFVFLIVLPSAILATSLNAPAWVVFACLKSDQILKCFVAAVKINRYNWMRNLTKKSTGTPPATDGALIKEE